MRVVHWVDLTCIACGTAIRRKVSQVRAAEKMGYPGPFCSKSCVSRRPRVPVEERFWSKVRKGDGCWEWASVRNSNGYGMVWYAPAQRMVLAHRLAYELTVGGIPTGFDLLHLCDNPPCVNPAHLKPGTHRENMADSWSKGRGTMPPRKRKATHCFRGHELVPPNLYVYADRRLCRACALIRAERSRRRQERDT